MILASSWWITAFEAVGAPIFVPEEHLTDENRVMVVLNDWRMDKEIKQRTEIRVSYGSQPKAYWHLQITEKARGVSLSCQMDAAWASSSWGQALHYVHSSLFQLGCMSLAVLSSPRAQCEFMDHLGGDWTKVESMCCLSPAKNILFLAGILTDVLSTVCVSGLYGYFLNYYVPLKYF